MVPGAARAQERPTLPTEQPTEDEARMGRKLQEALRTHGGDVHGCYGQALAEHPGLAGELLVRLSVSPGGTVERAEVLKDQTGSRRLTDCLVDAMRKWKVPELAGSDTQQLVFPLAFKPDETATVVSLTSDQPLHLGDTVSLRRVEWPRGTHASYEGGEQPGILFLLEGNFLTGAAAVSTHGGDVVVVPPHATLAYRVGAGPARALEIGFSKSEDLGATKPTVRAAAAIAPLSILGGKGRARLYLDGMTRAVALDGLEAEAGARVPLHRHDGSDEILYIVGGRGAMTVSGQRYDVKAGDAIRIPAKAEHALDVVEKLAAVQLYLPAGPEQRFKAAPAPASEKR
jgi:TonB family protein